MEIKVYNNNAFLFRCNFIWLEPYATGTSRNFVFKEISEIDVLQQTYNDFSVPLDILKVNVSIYDKFNNHRTIVEFTIKLIDFEQIIDNTWSVRGLVCFDDYFYEYRQGMIDIFRIWEKNEDINWFDIPNKSSFKSDYIKCCFEYTGLSTKIIEREFYNIDMSIIIEERDLFYLASLEFVGNKGYFGHNFYTFEDCFLVIFHNGGFSTPKKIRILNIDKINSDDIMKLYSDLKETLSKFNFIFD